MSYNFEVDGGKTIRLPTGGKYCSDDIQVTGKGEDLSEPLTEQDDIIEEIQAVLAGKSAHRAPVVESITITQNGTYITPDGVDGYSPVMVQVEGASAEIKLENIEIFENGIYTAGDGFDGIGRVAVEVGIPDGYIRPEGLLEITENGDYDVTEYAEVNVAVYDGSGGDPDLPTGYRRCDFIRFSDAQIVDTGITPTDRTKIKVLYTREASTAMYMYGVSSDGNTATVTAYLSSGGAWRFGDKSASRTVSVSEDIIHTAIVDKTGIVSDSGNTSFTSSAFTAIGSLLIGANRNASGTVAAAQYIGRIFLFEMWSGSTQVLKLIPVTDGVSFRFWDAIGRKFHDSITTTALEGGNL